MSFGTVWTEQTGSGSRDWRAATAATAAIDGTTITGITPSGTAGAKDVVVTNP